MQTVYESSLGVEAHMVQDLLRQVGIPAYIEGEFLQGAAGELPLRNLVRVRVSSEHAAAAREVIADWERRQPPDHANPPRRQSWTAFAFFVGIALGAFGAWWMLNTPVTRDGLDYDGDGRLEERYFYSGDKTDRIEYDRNGDGKPDVRYEYDLRGLPAKNFADDDFDGVFEYDINLDHGQPAVSYVDRDHDGRHEEIWRYRHGVVMQRDMLDEGTATVVKRQNYRADRLVSADIDTDKDGKWDRHVEYDGFEEPK